MAIKTDILVTSGGGGGGDVTSVNGDTGAVVVSLDSATDQGATTTNAITVGGLSVGTAYSLPALDGSENQVLQTNGTGTLSFATLDFTGGLEYKGAFNATAGTPSLANAEKGDFYIIDTAGTIYGQTWAVGDHLLINEDMGGSITNSKIDKIDNTQAVTSVNTQTGAVVVSGNDILADHTAVNYTASNNNVDGHFSGVDTKLGTLLADITSESLNDLSDVSFTAGAGIDNYVLTYDNATTSWGAEAAPTASAASETVAGVIEIATNAEAGAGTATDKALVPSNISSLDLSAMNNTTSAFIALSDIPTASHSTAGILETATNAEATNATANDKIITPANLSHIDLSTFDNDAGFISDITSESLNDLSDVSFTAGAGIDNYVLTYDNGTSSWGAEVVPSAPVTSVNTQTGAVVVSGNDILADHTAVNYTSANNNVDGHFSGVDSKLGTLLADITSESLNDLSDVSFTAGAGIDNYVLTYDNSTTSWGAEVVPSAPVTSVNTLTGAVVVSGNDIVADHIAQNYTAANANVDGHLSGIDTKFGTLGTASTQDVGTSANNVVQLDGTSRLPAVDGSQLTNLPSAPVTSVNTLTGAVVVSGNDIAADHIAQNYTAGNANVDGHLSGIDTKLGTLLADITGESLNDLSDVSFTAGAGIDNYVLTYDHATTSWGAEAAPTASGSDFTAVTADIARTDFAVTNYYTVLEESTQHSIYLPNYFEGDTLGDFQNKRITVDNQGQVAVRVLLRISGTTGNRLYASYEDFGTLNYNDNTVVISSVTYAYIDIPAFTTYKLSCREHATVSYWFVEPFSMQFDNFNPQNRDILVYNSTTEKYENSSDRSELVYSFQNSNFTAQTGYYYYVDSSAGDITVSLSTDATVVGNRFKIFKAKSANSVIITESNAINTIDPDDGASGQTSRSIQARSMIEFIAYTTSADFTYIITPQVEINDSDLNASGEFLIYDASVGANQLITAPYTMPSTDGTPNQIISTDGNGSLSFIDQPGGTQPTLTSASPSANYTISTHDGIEEIYVLTPSANISVFLPAASSCGSGYKYHIKNMASGFTLTIDANGSETIDGAGNLTATIANQYEALTLVTDGSNWFII